jgi:hypothetical protein
MHDEGLDRLSIRTVRSNTSRVFFIRFLPFSNGCFLAITEHSNRIGSVCISISTTNKINTAKIIPSKYNPMFLSTISERISAMINGICLASLYLTTELCLEDMKAIMDEIMLMVGEGEGGDNNDQGQRSS